MRPVGPTPKIQLFKTFVTFCHSADLFSARHVRTSTKHEAEFETCVEHGRARSTGTLSARYSSVMRVPTTTPQEMSRPLDEPSPPSLDSLLGLASSAMSLRYVWQKAAKTEVIWLIREKGYCMILRQQSIHTTQLTQLYQYRLTWQQLLRRRCAFRFY
jgi:hypothetical protein